MKMNKMVRKIMISMVMGMAVVLTACGSKTDNGSLSGKGEKQQSETQEDKAASGEKPEKETTPVFGQFQTETLSGEETDQEIFAKADLTMVNIWGTFCGPCIREMPDLGEIGREYADKGFQIVGLISDVSKANDETAQEIVDTTKADYTHIIASQDLITNILSRVQVVPTTIFVDKDGKQVGSVYSGAKEKSNWEEIIKGLLDEVQA